MGMDSVSKISAQMVYAVNAVHMSGAGLSEETIKKLRELGIDPTTVKSEAEARTLIAQVEKSKKAHNVANAQPQIQSANVDIKQLNDDIKKLGDKLGIDVKSIKDNDVLLNTLEAGVKEFVNGASVQANKSDATVKLKNGTEARGNSYQMEVDFNSIKDRIEELENAKKARFAGQDMLAAMNRMALGI